MESLHYVNKCVAKIDSKYGDSRCSSLPLILLLAKDPNAQDSEVSQVRNEGQNFANRFVKVSPPFDSKEKEWVL